MTKRSRIHIPSGIGERSSDALTGFIGTWRFVILQVAIITSWIVGNSVGPWPHPDSSPYIGLNLLLSAEAALATGVILMSQNRAAKISGARDDVEAAEVEQLLAAQTTLHEINKLQLEILELLKERVPC